MLVYDVLICDAMEMLVIDKRNLDATISLMKDKIMSLGASPIVSRYLHRRYLPRYLS